MTLVQLRYLAAIVDAGLNITTAARHVNATQPGLSKQLRQIEDELGFLVFTRRGKSLESLTPAGAEVVARARAILAETAAIQSLAANLRLTAQGEIRISTTHTQARYVLPTALAAFRSRFPEIAIHLQPSGEDEALAALERGGADLSLISGPDRPATADIALPLWTWKLVGLTASPPTWPAGAPRLTDLAGLPLVTYESAIQPGGSLSRAFAEAGLTPKIAFSARDSDLIKTYVRAGLGFGVLAELAVGDADRDLRCIPLDGLFPSRTTWAVLKKDRLQRQLVRGLLAEIAPHGAPLLARNVVLDDIEAHWPRPLHWRAVVDREPVG